MDGFTMLKVVYTPTGRTKNRRLKLFGLVLVSPRGDLS